jgi:hypothetical protein
MLWIESWVNVAYPATPASRRELAVRLVNLQAEEKNGVSAAG